MYTGQVTQELMTEIATAFREHRVDDIVNYFTEDAIFINAKGPNVQGASYRGKLELGAFFTRLFETSPDVRWDRVQEDWICGDRAVTQWHRKATGASGKREEWLGCDLYMFEGKLIKRKDTFIKVVIS